MAKILVAALVASFFTGCAAQEWLGDDNPLEELIEDAIRDHTGVEVDLSGESAE